MHKMERSFAKRDAAAASPQLPSTSHAVIRFPLLDLLVQGLKRLFNGTVFIDAIDGIRE